MEYGGKHYRLYNTGVAFSMTRKSKKLQRYAYDMINLDRVLAGEVELMFCHPIKYRSKAKGIEPFPDRDALYCILVSWGQTYMYDLPVVDTFDLIQRWKVLPVPNGGIQPPSSGIPTHSGFCDRAAVETPYLTYQSEIEAYVELLQQDNPGELGDIPPKESEDEQRLLQWIIFARRATRSIFGMTLTRMFEHMHMMFRKEYEYGDAGHDTPESQIFPDTAISIQHPGTSVFVTFPNGHRLELQPFDLFELPPDGEFLHHQPKFPQIDQILHREGYIHRTPTSSWEFQNGVS
ncbi:hypothetical protein ABW19_dt0207255 [Dactylella cylindrospora]|nr:hypothetical protein ABW19_dt0207255 [Dactylella cylindrospora]